MRALGSRVGVGEVLAGRALPGGDRRRPRARTSGWRCERCCARRRVDLERFELAFSSVFGDGRLSDGDDPLSELGAIEKAALPSMGMPDASGRPAAE